MMSDELPQQLATPVASPTTSRAHPSSFILHPSSFPLLLDPPASGSWNMAVDEALLEAAAADGQCVLRFYQWEQPTLSLGYFQTYADRCQHEASRQCPVVRRASGGGAIVHDRELTYSLALAERHPLAVNRLRTYRVVHESLIDALAQWGIRATMFDSGAPRERGAAKNREPFLCFQRRSPGDVLVGGVKVAGSAQRRCRGAVLQHGSLLFARSDAAPELDGLKELTGRLLDAEEFIQAWLEALARVLAVAWGQGNLAAGCRHRAAVLDVEKYASTAWNEYRGRR
jgi:lipoate-protein ligase A